MQLSGASASREPGPEGNHGIAPEVLARLSASNDHTVFAAAWLESIASLTDGIQQGLVVLASPVYHNSYSGVLKNCLDHLAIPQFLYKPVGLISHGAGLSAVQVCDHLRIVVRGLYGVALPRQLVTVKDDYDFDGEAAYLVGEGALERLEALVNEMMMFGKVTEVGLNGYRRLVRA